MEVNDISIDRMGVQYLSEVYNEVCEEYRRRLCKQWDLDCEKQSRWVLDRVGETLIVDIIGGFAINMDEIRIMVENGVSLDAFMQFVDYYTRDNDICPSIHGWFLSGYRGEKGGVG